eukprot:3094045-Rhodomonas_salina.6
MKIISFPFDSLDLLLLRTLPENETLREYVGAACDASAGHFTRTLHSERRQPVTSGSAGAALDWAALYFQTSVSQSLGTLGYRWERGHSAAKMVQTRLLAPERLRVLVVSGAEAKLFGSGQASGEDKAKLIRETFSRKGVAIPADLPLMAALGSMDTILLCAETAGEWEVAIGRDLARRIEFGPEDIVGEFKRHRAMPVTGKVRWRGEDSEWVDFDDSTAAQTTEVVPAWVVRMLKEAEAED